MTEKKNSAASAAAKSTKEEEENTDRVQKPEEAEAYIASKKASADARGHETQSAGTQMNSPQNTDEGASQFGQDVVIDGDKDDADQN